MAVQEPQSALRFDGGYALRLGERDKGEKGEMVTGTVFPFSPFSPSRLLPYCNGEVVRMTGYEEESHARCLYYAKNRPRNVSRGC